MRPLRRLSALVLAASLFAGCGSAKNPVTDAGSASTKTVEVAVAFYPIEEIVRSVGGAAVRVVTLVPPGEEAHIYEPTPQQVSALESADIVFYLGGGFQPNVEKAIRSLPASVAKVDLLAKITLFPVTAQLAGVDGKTEGEVLAGGNDPHVWLDPNNMQIMVGEVQQSLSSFSVLDATALAANGAAYDAKLTDLDAHYRAGLATCTSKVIVTGHRAFGYLAARYGLEQVAIAGISPEEEPSAKTLEAIAKAAKERNVTTIFFESSLPADLSKTVAAEIGARTDVLNPVESLTKAQIDGRASYISEMERNLATIEKGLGCG